MSTLDESATQLSLNGDELLRYSRHLVMPEVGLAGQRKLKEARVLAIGAGGLGSPLVLYLAAAGVGTIGLVDFDHVDYSNLQRQVIHTSNDVGRQKVDSAAEKVAALNPFVKVIGFRTKLTHVNALEIISGFDVIADGTDNFATRYLVNDACVLARKPDVYASVSRFEGRASIFCAGSGPCYRCLYPEPPAAGLFPSCAEGGVLGVLPGILGVIQAAEVIKLILGIGEPLIGRLLLVDALAMCFRELRVPRNPDCPVCGLNPRITELVDYDLLCGTREEAGEAVAAEVEPAELKRRLDTGEDIFVLDVREPSEYAICNIHGYQIPLGELPARLDELDPGREIVVHCKGGLRGAKAAALLREAGFKRVSNLAGGIMRWSEDVDPTLQKY